MCAKLAFFAQNGYAITFTTTSYVKHQILSVMRDADAVLDVKTGEINADVLTAYTPLENSLFCTATNI